MNATNRNLPMSLDSKNNAVFTLLRYPEFYIEEAWQNRPVLWFVIYRNFHKNQITDKTTDRRSLKKNNLKSTIYPNPGHGNYSILSTKYQKIKIISSEGRLLKEKQISEGRNSLNLSFLKPGIYFISFLEEDITLKFIKL